ncbi:MAG: lytic transglycosylase domain-containing protein [Coriobacteriales bacterium]|nr:lytic transglycosylase domain-containing protein [Coriobacteriales bacterium]
MAPRAERRSAKRPVGESAGSDGTVPLGLFTWYRVLILGVLVVLAGVTLLFLRGPAVWQKRYYPLNHEAAIADSSQRHGVNPYLVAAVINAESGFVVGQRSPAGAVGLMQVLPSTADELAERGVVDASRFPPDKLSDPSVNIEYGTAYLRHLIRRYHEVETALAAYNAGLRHADEWAEEGGDIRDAIEFPETRHYVLRVARGRDRYEALYPNAFEGVTKD